MQNNFLSPILFVLLIVLVLLSVVAVCYLYISARNRERLALIEKGMDPRLARSDFWPQIGIIGVGIAAGLIIDDLSGWSYGPLVAILFAGLGLVIFHSIRRSRLNRH